MGGRNAMMRMARGVYPIYEDMRANNDIRRKQKLNSMRRPKSREQPEIYSVVLC